MSKSSGITEFVKLVSLKEQYDSLKTLLTNKPLAPENARLFNTLISLMLHDNEGDLVDEKESLIKTLKKNRDIFIKQNQIIQTKDDLAKKLIGETSMLGLVEIAMLEDEVENALEQNQEYESYITNFDNLRGLYQQRIALQQDLLNYEGAWYSYEALNSLITFSDIPGYEVPDFSEIGEMLIEHLDSSFIATLDKQTYPWEFENDLSAIPETFQVKSNYPNPFNPTTRIPFDLPENSYVIMRLYNIRGQKVATLTQNHFIAGSHTLNYNGSHLSSGIYILKTMIQNNVTKDRYAFTSKMTLVK